MACAPCEDSDQPGHPSSLISLRCPHEKSLGPELPTEHTAKTLIRLGGCPGRSESSLGAQSFCWICHEAAHIMMQGTAYSLKIFLHCSSFLFKFDLKENHTFTKACSNAKQMKIYTALHHCLSFGNKGVSQKDCKCPIMSYL